MSSPHILIIGAGLGGLALAQCLRKQGISYEIFERDAKIDSRSQGWSISIHGMPENLSAAVPDDMEPVESLDQLKPLGLPTQVVLYNQMKPSDKEMKKEVLQAPPKTIIVNRARLRSWLTTNIPIQFGKRVLKIEEGEKVTLHFQDGTTATGDLVVGADGAHSTVRKHILKVAGKPDPLRQEPLLPISLDVTLRGADVDQQIGLAHSAYVTAYRGPNGEGTRSFTGLVEAVDLPKEGEEDKEKVVRYFMNAMYKDPTVLPTEQSPEGLGNEHWSRTATAEELLAHLNKRMENLPSHMRTIVERATPEDVTTPPLKLYTLLMDELPVSKLTLLGDGAHAMTPFRGQGGVHAMTDAIKLSRTIAAIGAATSEAEKEAALDAYQKEMLARGSKAAVESLKAFDAAFREPQTDLIAKIEALPIPADAIGKLKMALGAGLIPDEVQASIGRGEIPFEALMKMRAEAQAQQQAAQAQAAN